MKGYYIKDACGWPCYFTETFPWGISDGKAHVMLREEQVHAKLHKARMGGFRRPAQRGQLLPDDAKAPMAASVAEIELTEAEYADLLHLEKTIPNEDYWCIWITDRARITPLT